MNNIFMENQDNENKNIYYNGVFDDLDLDDIHGIYSDNENKSNLNESQDINKLLANEEEIPYSPLMSEEPIHPSETKKLISDNINHIIKKEKIHEEIFTFKNQNNKSNNFNYDANDMNNIYQKLSSIKYHNADSNGINNIKNDIKDDNKNEVKNYIKDDDNKNIIKANVVNLEDLIEQRNSQILNKSVDIDGKKTKKLNNKNKNCKSYDKIDFQKLNQKGKVKKQINKSEKKNHNYTQKKPNNKIKLFENNSKDVVGFDNFVADKQKEKLFPQNRLNNNLHKNKKQNYKFNNNAPKQKEIISKNNQDNFNKRNINHNSLRNPKNTSKIPINFKKIKKEVNKSKDLDDNSSFLTDINIKDNSILSTKANHAKMRKLNTLRDFRKKEDHGVPYNVTEEEINLALKNKNIGKNIKNRFSSINNALFNFDNSKFMKYDTDQIRYELVKDYSNIHSNKDNSFLQRMQFDAVKRKNKENKLNELVENNKKKYKINEKERKKAFNRLMDDANRRLINRQEMIENEKYLLDFKNMMDNGKKYNGAEWSEIYKKRFKDYEDYKKKKIDIQRQNEKIKKMIEEEEEINMCQMKKIPESKIRENTQRLYEDAKKREIIKNKNLSSINSVKNYKINKKKNLYLDEFNDEEDASKYMKGFKGEDYSFVGEGKYNLNYNYNFNTNSNNSQINKYKNYFGVNNNLKDESCFNKSTDKKMNKKSNKMTVTEFNNMRFDTRNHAQKNNKKKKNMRVININDNNYNLNNLKGQLNDLNFNINNSNNLTNYYDFKKNKLQNGQFTMQNNNFSSPNSYENIKKDINYNNYNLNENNYNYNISNNNNIYNVNNNYNNIINIDNNDEDSNDNLNLNDIAEKILHTAAMNKINNTNINVNRNYNFNNLNDLNNLNSMDNGIRNQMKNKFENIKISVSNYLNNNNNERNNIIENRNINRDYIENNQNLGLNNPGTETNDIIQQFLSNQYECYN